MSTPGQEDDKNPGDSSVHTIYLKVKDQDGIEIVSRIKRNTQLKKVMNHYCEKQSVDLNSITFLFEGRRIHGKQTPDESAILLSNIHTLIIEQVENFEFFVLDMVDGDEIDVMEHQIGGARA